MSGIIVNDLWDKDFDKQVQRTKSRPLAAGTMSPGKAVGLLGVHLAGALAILLSLNNYT
jgi:4-hydroxybenzoate polyprenyltransferase